MAPSFKVNVEYVPYRLDFKFDAGTSRGVLKTKSTFFVKVSSESFPEWCGYGEAGPLPKLSVDDREDFEEKLYGVCQDLSNTPIPQTEDGVLDLLGHVVPDELPSIRFALEVALLDLIHGGKRKILPNKFYDKQEPIHINGLIWMGEPGFMMDQISQKLEQGYNCIKMKIGSIDFEQECALLEFIRERYSPDQITLRVDANGAFSPAEALIKLQRLSKFGLHSIEQPIRQGQWKAMADLCAQSPIPIALDEELIGISAFEEKKRLLNRVKPPYIILKPTLVGGIKASREWIALAEKADIGWWMTSALESNIGLNAIAQLTSTYDPTIPQGLGTGQLYHNNIDSPLSINEGKIVYGEDKLWGEMDKLFG